MGVMTIKHIG